jgi:hypothetical protein
MIKNVKDLCLLNILHEDFITFLNNVCCLSGR